MARRKRTRARAHEARPAPPLVSEPEPVAEPARGHVPPSPRARALVLAGLAVLVLAVLGDVLLARGSQVLGAPGADLELQFVSWRQLGFGELARGNVALWNPHVYGGAPYFGGMQAALLYPVNLLFLVLPLAQAINWSIAIDLWLFGAFTACWALGRGLHPLAAFVSGAVAMLCGPHYAHVFAGHVTNVAAMAWAPLIFLAFDEWLRARRPGPLLLGMLAVALQVFAGHPQYVFYTAIALGLYGVMRLWRAARPEQAWGALALCTMYVGGALLSAVQLFAAVQATAETIRSTRLPYDFASDFFLPLENLVTLVAPSFFGDGLRVPYWGRFYAWEATLFSGVCGLALAVYGAVCAQTEGKRALLGLGASCLVLALGETTALYALLYEWVPGFDRFRAIGKFALFVSLPLALLAGVGLDRAIRNHGIERPALRAGAIAAGVLLAASFAIRSGSLRGTVLFMRDSGDSYLPRAAYEAAQMLPRAQAFAADALLVAAATLGATWLLVRTLQGDAPASAESRHPRSLRVGFALLGVVALELLVVARLGRATFDAAEVVHPELRRFVAQHRGDYRISNPVNPNSAISLGALEVWGSDPGVTRRYAELFAQTQGIAPERVTQYVELREPHPLLALFRLGYLVAATPAGLRVAKGPRPPLPRFLLVGSHRVIDDRDRRLAALAAPEFDPRAEVVLEQRPDPPPSVAARPGSVKLLREDTDSLELAVTTSAPAVLLITDAWTPSWRAEPLVGSVQSAYAVLPADHAFRGIPLRAGEHRLRLSYAPSAYTAGAFTSLAAWAAFLGALWALRRSRVRQRRDLQASTSTSESGSRPAAASAAPPR